MDDLKKRGAWIKQECLRRGMTQTALAKATGMRRQSLYSIFNGLSNPSEASLRSIARALGLAEDYFLKSDTDAAQPVAIHRLHFYIDLDEGDDLSDEQITLIQKRLVKYGHDLKNLILYGK